MNNAQNLDHPLLFLPTAVSQISNFLKVCFVITIFSFLVLYPQTALAATLCGGAGQRACCVVERVPSCNPGYHEVMGCSGDCKCGGANPLGALNSTGHCVPNAPPPVITPCGGPNQRACCVVERVPSCNSGYHEVMGCSGNCKCGGANPGGVLNSTGHCVPNAPPPVITPCGGPNQRACCVVERVPSCNPGYHEVMGCSGNCNCGTNPLGEALVGAAAGQLKSIGHCVPNAPQPVITPCGGLNQRACCITERPYPCNPGTIQIPGCNGNCKCGGANPGGALNAVGHCESGCSAAMKLIKKLEDDLAAAHRNAQQFCGQAPATIHQQPQMHKNPALMPVQKRLNSF